MQFQTLEVDAGRPPGMAGPQRVPADRAESRWHAVVRVLRSPAGIARTLADDMVTTVFPAECRSCSGPLAHASTLPVCRACLERLRPSGLLGCARCGDAADLGIDLEDARFAGQMAEGLLCRECRLAPPAFERAVSFSLYDDEVRTLIHLLKYERVPSAAKLLGRRLAEAIATLEAQAAADLLVIAVPLFPQRERERGYNQSVLLADAALAQLRRTHPQWKLKPAHAILVRRKSTESQFTLSRRGRRRNLQGAFAVVPSKQGDVAGREVLLIDDILTSGATARECARVLRAAGASKVWVATVARAQKRSVERIDPETSEFATATWDLPATAH